MFFLLRVQQSQTSVAWCRVAVGCGGQVDHNVMYNSNDIMFQSLNAWSAARVCKRLGTCEYEL